tara:strand:- start:186 stop:1439 length:1254 start_codon:yes stop_codon:yes gene_type:complete
VATPTWLVQIKLADSSSTTYRDVTDDVRAMVVDVGRTRVLDTFVAGSCRLSLNNQDNKYGPLTGGTYSDAQWINAEIRILVTLNSASQPTPLFRGFVDDIDVSYPNSKDSIITVKGSDGLSKIARTELVDNLNGSAGNAAFAEEVGSTRFTNVLNNGQVAYPNGTDPLDREVDTSVIVMAADTIAQISTNTYLSKLAQSEDGAVFCRHGVPGGAAATAQNRGNVLTYKKRYAPSTATGLTFGAASATSTLPPMTGLGTSYGAELLYTRGVYSGSTGNDQEYEENVLGTPAFGIRTIVRRNLLNLNDADVKEAATNFVALHSTPVLRVTNMTCQPLAMTDAQAEKVAKISIFDGFSVRFRPAGASVDMLEVVRCEGVRHDITPGRWEMKLSTSGSGASQFFILDSEIDGILDNNKLAP